MKKLIILLTTVCAFLIFGGAMTAFAAEDGTPPNNVTITVVLPDAETAEPASATTPATAVTATTTLYPVDVTENARGRQKANRKNLRTIAA